MAQFPPNDRFWKDTLNYIRAFVPTDQSVSAPVEFQKLVCNWRPLDVFSKLGDWVVIHKGVLEWVDLETAKQLPNLRAVFANEVFVVLSRNVKLQGTKTPFHVNPLWAKLTDMDGPFSLGTRRGLEKASRKHRFAVGLGDNRVLCKVLGRFNMVADMGALEIAPHLIQEGFWESWITTLISTLLERGGHYVDVGSNIGYYSVLFAHAAGDTGQVLAIDPRERFCGVARENLVMNGRHGHWKVVRAAAGNPNRMTKTSLWEPPGYASSAYTASKPVSPSDKRICEAPVVAIDDLVKDWPKVDIVKIDAEGANSQIWEGLRQTRRRPETRFFVEYAHALARDRKWLVRARKEGFKVSHVGFEGQLIEGLPSDLQDWVMLCLEHG